MAESFSQQPSFTVLVGGSLSGKGFVVSEDPENILIGSDVSCAVCIPLPEVSPIHARVTIDEKGIVIHETHSPRGLYVNDDRVNGEAPLRNGDVVWLGPPGDKDVVMIQCHLPPPAMEGIEAAPEEAGIGVPSAPMPEEAGLDVVPSAEEQAAEFFEVAGEEPGPPPQALPQEPDFIETVEPAPAGFAETEAIQPDLAETMADVPAPKLPGASAAAALSKFQVELPETASMPAAEFEEEIEPTVAAMPAAPPSEETVLLPTKAPPAAPARPPAPPPAAPVAPPAPRPAPVTRPPAATHPSLPPTPRPRPAAPPPRPAPRGAPTPPPRPAARPSATRTGAIQVPKQPSAVGKYAAIAAAALLVLGGGGYALMRVLSPGQPEAPAPTPVPVAQATPIPPTTVPEFQPLPEGEPLEGEGEEAAGGVTEPVTQPPVTQPAATLAPASGTPPPTPRPTPTPKRTATPPPAQATQPSAASARTQRVAGLLGEADSAVQGGRHDAAVRLYEQVLEIDPANAQASAGKDRATAAAAAGRKTFVGSRTAVRTGRGKGKPGFEAGGVSVAEPDYSGRIQFEVNPARVKAGDSYKVRIYLTNDGKKPYRIEGLEVVISINGTAQTQAAQPPREELGPGNRITMAEISAVWPEGVQAWYSEVQVSTDHGDSFKSRVTWK